MPEEEDRRVNPENPKHVGLALGFGIMLTPCAVVELSEDPTGGLTRVALPFLSMWNTSDSVEPMLRALGVVVWHLTNAVFPWMNVGCELRRSLTKWKLKRTTAPSGSTRRARARGSPRAS